MSNRSSSAVAPPRSIGKGYAGIENYLFYHDKARMLFGNAKDSLRKLVAEVKSL
ncbi:MAG: NAD(P)(+) transhydrogenase (Re/Si-specific) subunit beta [Bacteroidales bacterium]|nr:NAD(P)(+) transhydrogenase (Re/Si-specific) subunit beta [Bacteroidales bacterium]